MGFYWQHRSPNSPLVFWGFFFGLDGGGSMENTCNDLINYGKIKSKYKINQRRCWRMESNWYPSAVRTKARVEATQGRSWEPAVWQRLHIWLWVSGDPRSLGSITRNPQHNTVVYLFIYYWGWWRNSADLCKIYIYLYISWKHIYKNY